MASASAIIGKVAVKVIPDTKTFKKEAQAKLDEIEKQLHNVEVTLVPTIDGKELKRKAETLKREVETAVGDIRLKVDLDNQDSLKKNLALLENQLSRMKEVVLDVSLNSDDIQAAMELLNEQLDKVANLDVRVNPEDMTSVKKALATVDAELERLRETTINVKLNEPDLKAAKELFEEQLAGLQREADLVIEAQLQENRAAEQKVLDGIKARLANIQFAPGVDETKLASTRAEIESYLIKIAGLKSEIKMGLDPIALRKTQLEIDALEAKIHKITVEVKPELDETRSAGILASLAVFAKVAARVVTIPVKLTLNQRSVAEVASMLAMLSGFNVLRNKIRLIMEFATSLDMVAIRAATTGTAFMAMSGAAASSLGNILSLGAGIASIAQAGLALPGILGGLVVGLGASFIALKDFNKEVPQLTTYWTQLQNTIKTNFWDEAKKPMTEMVNTLLPIFNTQLKTTSGLLGGFFGNLATSLKTTLGPSLAGMFANLNSSISIFSTKTGAIANIITVLGRVGAAWLPRLATWAGNIAQKFSDWLDAAEKSGRLNEMIETGVNALKQLWSVLTGIVDIFSAVTRAAKEAGSSTLGSLGEALHKVADILSSPEIQKAMVGIFQAAHQMFAYLATVAEPFKELFLSLSQILQVVLPIIGQVFALIVRGISEVVSSDGALSGLTAFFQSVLTAMQDLMPVFAALGNALGPIGRLLGTILEGIAPLLATTAGTLMPILTALVGPIQKIVEALTSGLLDALVAIEPLFIVVAQAVGELLQSVAPLVSEIAGALVPILKALVPVVGEVFTSLAKSLGPVLVVVGKSIADILTALGPVISVLISSLMPIIPVIAQVLGQLAAILGPVIAKTLVALQPAIAAIAGAFTQLLGAILPMIPLLVDALAPILPILAQAFTAVIQALAPLIPPIAQLVTELLPPIIQLIGDLAKGPLKDIIDSVVQLVQAIAPLVVQFVQLLVEVLPYLMPLITDLAKLIASALSDAVKFVSDLLSGLVQILRGVIDFVVGVFTGDWGRAWRGIKEVFGGIWSELKAFFLDIPKTLLDVGINIVKGLWDGITSMGSWLKNKIFDWAGNLLPGWVKDILGIHSPSRVFAEIGTWVTKGLGVGITDNSALSSLHANVKDMTDSITSVFQNSGQAVMDSFVDGLESRYSAVKSSLSGLASDISAQPMGQLATPGGSPSALAASAYAPGSNVSQRTLIYNAAPGSSISPEEDLFTAAGRARGGF